MGDVAYLDIFRVCTDGTTAGMILSYFMLFPFLLFFFVACIHFFIKDIFSVFMLFFSSYVFWVLSFAIQFAVESERPNLRRCENIAYFFDYGLPDPWFVSTTVFVLTWLWAILQRGHYEISIGFGFVSCGWVGYVVAARYLDYLSWTQWLGSAAFAGVLAVASVLITVFVIEPDTDRYASGIEKNGYLNYVLSRKTISPR